MHGRLLCMARAAGVLLAAKDTWWSPHCAHVLLDDLARHADPAATEACRLTAVNALELTGMLKHGMLKQPLSASDIVTSYNNAWQLAWQLLQDEDDDVRDATAAMCSRCCTHPAEQNCKAEAMPACLEDVQKHVVGTLAQHACQQPALLEMLLHWICKTDDLLHEEGGRPTQSMTNQEERDDKQPATTAPSWVHRLFEQEKVNDFEEPLTAARLTAHALLDAAKHSPFVHECSKVLGTWLRSLYAARDVRTATDNPSPLLLDLFSTETLRQRALQLHLAICTGEALLVHVNTC